MTRIKAKSYAKLYRDDDLLSVKDAATFLGVSTKTLYRWEAAGKLIGDRTSGGHRRYAFSDLKSYVNKKLSASSLSKPKPAASTIGLIAKAGESASQKPKEASILTPPTRIERKLKKQDWEELYSGIPTRHKNIASGSIALALGIAGFLVLSAANVIPNNPLTNITKDLKEHLGRLSTFVERYSPGVSIYKAEEEQAKLAREAALKVLADTSSLESMQFTVNIPANFTQTALFQENVELAGVTNVTGTFQLDGASVTASADEINYLDGVTLAAGEIFYSDGTSIVTLDAGSSGQFLTSNGTSAPSWKTQSSDASTVDGIDSASFLRSDTSDAFTSGTLTTNSGTTLNVIGILDVDGTASFSGGATFTSGAFTFSDGTLLDLSAILHDDTEPQGIKLPQNTSLSSPSSGEGFLAWDSDDNKIQIYNGTSWVDLAGVGGSLWTDAGTITYLTATTDDIAVGGTTLASSIFSIDESAGIFLFGGDQSANPTLRFEATDSDTADFGFNTNDTVFITGGNLGIGTTNATSALTVTGDGLFSGVLALNGASIDSLISINNLRSATTSSDVYGLYNTMSHTGAGAFLTGVYNTFTGTTNGTVYRGAYNSFDMNNHDDNGYGVYNSFNGNDISSGETAVGYGLYNTATGFSSSDAASLYGVRNVFGTQTAPTISVYGANSSSTLSGEGYSYGMFNTFSANGTGAAYGMDNNLSSNSSGNATLYGADTNLTLSSGDVGYGYYVTDGNSTGGTTYGLYVDVDDADSTNYSIYVNSGSGISYFGSNVGIGDPSPSSALEIGNGTDSLQISSVGDLVFVDADGAASITGPAGGTLTVAAGATQDLTLTGADDIIFDDAQITNIQLSDADTSLPNSNTGIVDAINDAYNAAIGSGGGVWTLTSGVIHPTTATNDLAIGGSTLAASIFSIDESAGTFLFGGDQSANPTLTFEATDSDTADFGFNTNDSFYFSGGNVGINDTSPDALLDFDFSSTASTAGAEYGGFFTFTDTGIVTTGVDSGYGLNLDVNRSGATGGTLATYGINIDLDSDAAGSGSARNYGLFVNVAGGDVNYAAVFEAGSVGIGDATPDVLFDVDGSGNFDLGASDNVTIDAETTDSTGSGGALSIQVQATSSQKGIRTTIETITDGGGDTLSGYYLTAAATSTDADDIYGVHIIDLGGTPTAGNEYAIYQAGTAWDYGLYVEDLARLGSGAESAGNITPTTNDTYDLGSNTLRWQDIYLGPGSIHIGTSTSDEYSIAYDTTNNRLGFNVNGSGQSEVTFDSAGNVGIGDTQPYAKLMVHGSDIAIAVGAARSGSSPGGLQFLNSGVKHVGFRFNGSTLIYEDASNTSTPSTWYGSATANFAIRNGSLGIGTTTPASELQIAGTTPLLTIGDAGAEDSAILFDGNAVDFHIGLDDSLDKLVFGTGSTLGTNNRLTIESTGDVGIGTTDPSFDFEVDGGSGSSIARINGDSNQLRVSNGTADYMIFSVGTSISTIDLTGGNGLWVRNGTTSVFEINMSGDVQMDGELAVDGTSNSYIKGNLGIGTTAPGSELHVGGTTPTITIGDAGEEDTSLLFDGNALDFYAGLDDSVDDFHIGTGSSVGTSATFTILGNATRVGIGTTAPLMTFVVNTTTVDGETALFKANTVATNESIVWIDTNDSTAADEYFLALRSDVDGTPDNEFLFRTNGTAVADGSFTGGGADVAEWTPTKDKTLSPGDVLIVDGSSKDGLVKKSDGTPYDKRLMGVVSTNPGLVAGGGEAESQHGVNDVLVALAGRVPVKISSSSATIAPGDYLTSSSEPGKAMKATGVGQVIGKALESWSAGSKEKIEMFVNLGSNAAEGINLTLSGQGQVLSSLGGDIGTLADKVDDINFALNEQAEAIAQLDSRVDELENQTTTSNPQEQTSETNDHGPLEGRLRAVELVLASIAGEGGLTQEEIDAMLTDTDGDSIESIENLLSIIENSDVFTDLVVTGTTSTNSLLVENSVAVGSDFLISTNQNEDALLSATEINTTTSPLRIQSAGLQPIDIMAGAFVIDTSGNATFSGDVELKGDFVVAGAIKGSNSSRGINVEVEEDVQTLEIVFEEAKSSPNYAVTVTPNWDTRTWVTNKTEAGYTANFSAPAPDEAKFDWVLIE